MNIATVLKTRREALGMSINMAAMRSMVEWNRWKKWEDGTAEPSLKLLPRIAAALGCKVTDLVR